MRKRALNNAHFIANKHLGDKHLTVHDLQKKLQEGRESVHCKKSLFEGYVIVLGAERKVIEIINSVQNK